MATTTTTHKHDAYTQGTFPCACRIDYDRDGIAAVTYCPTHAHAFAMRELVEMMTVYLANDAQENFVARDQLLAKSRTILGGLGR
jgi:hypothetical protein